MALDYTPSLAGHDARRKIGIITEANIVPMPQSKTSSQPARLRLVAICSRTTFRMWSRRFRAQPNSTLGMSYEIANITRTQPGCSDLGGHRLHVHRSSGAASRQGSLSANLDFISHLSRASIDCSNLAIATTTSYSKRRHYGSRNHHQYRRHARASPTAWRRPRNRWPRHFRSWTGSSRRCTPRSTASLRRSTTASCRQAPA